MIPDSNVPNASFLWWLDIVSTSLSTLGSLYMMVSCLRKLSNPNLSIRIILAIAIADLFFSIANILSNFESANSDGLCFVEAALRQSSFLFAMFFSALAAIAPYLTKLSHSRFNRNIFLLFSLLFCILISWVFVFLVVRIFDEIIITNGPFVCWYSYDDKTSRKTAFWIVMLLEGIPIMIGLLILLIGYITTFISTRRMPRYLLNQLGFNPYHLFWYPVVFFVTFTPGLFNRIYMIEKPGGHSLFLEAIYLGFKHLVGFSNAIVYGLQRDLYKREPRDTIGSRGDYEIDRNDSRGYSFLELDDGIRHSDYSNNGK